MDPYYQDESVTLYHGDCLDVLAALSDRSIDAIVTDPPYGLEFMGKEWDSPWKRGDDVNADAGFSKVGMTDHQRLPRPTFTGTTNPKCLSCKGTRRGRRDGTALVKVCTCDAPQFPNVRATEMTAFQDWCQQWAAECLRVLKPGGHMLAFGGTRTWHRLACAVEDVGFEIRDSIAWLYGSGFPKSLDVSKAIDKAAGAERKVVGSYAGASNIGKKAEGKWGYRPDGASNKGADRTVNVTAAATDAAKQWAGYGTALKPAFEPIVVARKPIRGTVAANVLEHGTGAINIDGCRVGDDERETTRSNGEVVSENGSMSGANYGRVAGPTVTGRWPPNVLLDDSQAAELDRQSGIQKSGVAVQRNGGGQRIFNQGEGLTREDAGYGDTGGASRFFATFRYTAKASARERPSADGVQHPTVKPVELMRWLVRLVTPPGGTVLDPFAGSGTTGEAAILEHKRAVLIEREPTYLPLIVARLGKPMEVGFDFGEGA